MRGIFLDISKTSDKVWHAGLLCKLKAYGVQRVVLNSQSSEWREIISEVPQILLLGLLSFVIYINDLPDGITSLSKIFAYYTSLFSKGHELNRSVNEINAALQKIANGSISGK